MPEKSDSGQAKRALFEREALPHLDSLYATALRLVRSPDDANDLVQDTVLRAYRFFHQFTPGTNCRAWLMTILFNTFRNGYRRNSREQVAASEEEFSSRIEAQSLARDPAQSSPEALAGNRTVEPEVERALDALPEEFRCALLLVDVQEMNYQEVSAALAIPVGTVKSRISRARAMMRKALRGFARNRRQ
jgi:RNA polymerase sigma-70 factor (ECF subfamily)